MLLADKLKRVRKELGLSQKDIADAIGCKVGKIKQIEAAKTASISFADANLLEKKFRISEQWLRFDNGEMFVEPTLDDIEILDQEFSRETVLLPYYEDVRASAGAGCITLDEFKKEFISIPKKLLPNSYEVLEVVGIHGDSMEPTFFEDDLIVVDKDRKEIINNRIYVILYENELFIKRVFRLPHGKIILKSDNAFYPDIEIQTDNFKIIGQVVTAVNFKKLT